MKISKAIVRVAIFLAAAPLAWQQTPPPVTADTVVLRVGDQALTKADYEKLVLGFDRASGAVTTGPMATVPTGKEVAKLLALVAEAERRKIDQDPTTQALIRVRGYVLLANTLLIRLRAEMKADEAGTRALWATEKNYYTQLHARQILVRYAGVKTERSDMKGATRTEEEAKALAALLKKKIEQGADFKAVAKSDSDDGATSKNGGELPVFARGLMTAEFETVAFGLPAGGVSEPFKTQYGYHIVQVLERLPAPFEKVRAALEDMRARQKFEEIGTAGVQLNEGYFKP